MTPRRRACGTLAGFAALLAGVRAGAAEPRWPAGPVRLVVVYPPGGVSDLMSRALADALAPLLGVPVLVLHRAGAGGGVGMEHLARAAPDGHTLAFSAITPLTLSPVATRGTPDLLQAVAPVAGVMKTPVLVAGTPAWPGRGLAALIEAARARPGVLRWATSGVATTGHMVLAQVRAQSGVAITHVPYKGGGQQITDALGGQFEVLSTNVGPLQLQHVAAGLLQPLAVGSPVRLQALPQVPTLAELGYPRANLTSHFGVFAPRGTPDGVLARLEATILGVMATPSMQARLAEAHLLPAPDDATTFAREITRDRLRHEALVARGVSLLD